MRIVLFLFASLLTAAPALAQEKETLAYRWDKDSGLFIRAEKVPVSDKGDLQVAKRTTLDKPLDCVADKWPKRDEVAEKWSCVDLFVGKAIYEKTTKKSRKVELSKDGNAIPEGWTSVAPPENCEFCEWNEESASWPENTAKKSAAAEEIARKKAISDDATRKALRDKLQSASLSQIRSYVKGLFPGLSAEQQEFLVGLLLLLAN